MILFKQFTINQQQSKNNVCSFRLWFNIFFTISFSLIYFTKSYFFLMPSFFSISAATSTVRFQYNGS